MRRGARTGVRGSLKRHNPKTSAWADYVHSPDVCVLSACCKLESPRKRILNEELSLSDWPVSMLVGHFLEWLMGFGATPELGVLDSTGKHAEQASRSKSVRSIPP